MEAEIALEISNRTFFGWFLKLMYTSYNECRKGIIMTNHQQVELVFYASSSLLEGPHWDVASQRLYVVSIKGEMIYAIDTKTNEVTSYPTEGPVGCAVIDDVGLIISAEQAGILKTDPKTK